MKNVLLFLAPFITAGASTFVDFLVNSAQPFSPAALQHAALAAIIVELTLIKSMLTQAAAK